MSKKVFLEIKSLLEKNKIKFEVFEHEPVYTSEQAAIVRERLTGLKKHEALKRGAKAMVVKDNKNNFYQLIISANEKINFNKVKEIIGTRVKFANPEEVKKITDCVPGSVPPFGNLFNLKVYCDESLKKNDIIDFNAGELTISIIMKYKDWEKVVKPILVDFS